MVATQWRNMKNTISIKGARVHNLKNVNLEIPKNKLVVFTGVSGSGKSSLAFDTIYAEGQRRYVESLSTYARQFLGIMEKPEVDVIEGLSPAISIDQKTTSRNPRSTVGTVTEIYDYLRLLYARVGHPHCPICGREISSQSVDQIVEAVLNLLKVEVAAKKRVRFSVHAPIVRDKKGEFGSLFDNLKAKGFKQVRIDGLTKNISEELVLIKTNKHTIDVVIDKISLTLGDFRDEGANKNLKSRLTESIEQALKLTDGLVIISEILDKGFEIAEFPKEYNDHLFSEKFSCPIDNIQIPEIEPRTFSFNSPHGACPTCNGIGRILKVDPGLIFSDELSLMEGAILPFGNMFEHDTWYSRLLLTFCKENNIDSKKAFRKMNKREIELILYGTGKKNYQVKGTNRFGRETYIYEHFTGVLKYLQKKHTETESEIVRASIEKYMKEEVCSECTGARLKKEAVGVTIEDKSINMVTAFSVTLAINWLTNLEKDSVLSEREKMIGKLILKEIVTRLKFLSSVGLEYLTLDRSAGSLSGGEAQRIRLASQIGSGLTGVLYVLDEPTIGLHQKDNQKLIETLKELRDLGNTVLVVEHDQEMMKNSDYIVDFGPGAGKFGGAVVALGTPKQITGDKKSLTGKYISGKKRVKVEKIDLSKLDFNSKKESSIVLRGANQFNLKEIDVIFPLRKLVVLTGVSGSGKSTLLVDTLYPALKKAQNPYFRETVGDYKSLEGIEHIDKVILIDQSPIGRTPRSNPATYTKLFDPVREVFAQTREARAAGYEKGRFSFNVKGGRCEACEGQGQTKIEMQFMSDIWVKCDVCKGARYNDQTLEVEYKGKNIAEVLKLTAGEALEFFQAHPKIFTKLETLNAVGLSYMELGQPATTLSGGEAQRVKLSTELSKRETGSTIYILDEPTTGLHFADIEKLLRVLKLLVAKGNSVFVIEHNIDVIKHADWIIDLGPEGGDAGGSLVAQGTPAEIKKSKKSYTAEFLRSL